MTYENRQYVILNTSELPLVDFTQVLETSADTVRRSADGTKTFVKFEGNETPSFINHLTSIQGPYNHNEILTILTGPEWIKPID
jgi:hypothetical protein